MKVGDRIYVLDEDGERHEGEVDAIHEGRKYSIDVVLDGDPQVLSFLSQAVKYVDDDDGDEEEV